MKKYSILILLLTLTSSVYAGFVNTQYAVHITNFEGYIPNKPEGGFTNLNYPIAVLSGPLEESFYYSQYVNFNSPTSDDNGFYFGIQPLDNGRARVLFSYFGSGGRITDKKHCSEGADGDNGISCTEVEIPFKLGTSYKFSIMLLKQTYSDNFWEGYVTDMSTNIKTQIGAWSTPKEIGFLSDSSIGFIEYYMGIDSCADIPATSAYFGAGNSKLDPSSISKGTIDAAYSVGVCKNLVEFSSFADIDEGITIVQKKGRDQ